MEDGKAAPSSIFHPPFSPGRGPHVIVTQVVPHPASADVPIVRDLSADLRTPPPDYIPLAERATFKGFRRADGRTGTPSPWN